MKDELKQLGLTENESKVYLALLELGSTNAGKIIKKTKLHRNIVYDNLDKLIDKGLVSFIIVGKIKHFETTAPTELKEYIEKQKKEILEKEKLVSEILPQIRQRRESIERKQEAMIFKGKKALKILLDEMTQSKTELLVFGTGWGMRTILKDYYYLWHKKLIKNKIKSRIILPVNRKEQYKKPFKMRFLPEKEIIPSSIGIYDDKVVNVIWQEEPIAIMIVSEKVAQSYKKYFNMLWRIAKK